MSITWFHQLPNKISAADIEYDAKSKLLFVPTFFGNSVMAYEVK